VKLTVAVPVLLIDIPCALLVVPVFCAANVSELGLSEIEVAVTCPVPLSVTDWGELVALSVNVNAAVRAPDAVGVNVTFTWHCAPAATDVPQVFPLVAKSPEFVPPRAMELKLTSALPVLLTVIAWLPPVIPTFCAPKLNAVGFTFSVNEGAHLPALPAV
jgi:hypothetical protein